MTLSASCFSTAEVLRRGGITPVHSIDATPNNGIQIIIALMKTMRQACRSTDSDRIYSRTISTQTGRQAMMNIVSIITPDRPA
jgi:hypothetical protein